MNRTEAVFHVAVNGKDAWSGTLAEPTPDRTNGPFLTLECARDALRALRSSGKATGRAITVEVRGGVHLLNRTFLIEAQDSGTKDAPVVYRACKGEKVHLAGAVSVPPESFEPVKDPQILARLDPSARGHVLRADLRALGIADLGRFPAKYRGTPPVPELFFNGQRMSLACWPNEGWALIAGIVDSGSCPRTGDDTNRPGVFEYEGDRPARWNTDAGVWLHGYWCYDWHEEVIQVKTIDAEKRQITLAAPAMYSVRHGNPSPRRYRALNLLEEIDRPGEYFIDRAAGHLYFWPPAPLAGGRVLLSTLNAPVVALKDAAHVVLRGFIVEASLANGIEVASGMGNRIQACEVRNARLLGINVSGGEGHTVEACDVHHTGTGGITLAGGDRRTLTPGGHQAVNNHIWRFSEHQLTAAYAIILGGVGHRIAHNLIHDAPHQAIMIGGNDHVVEYNVVHDVCTQTDDCGACYKGRNPSCRGNIIRYNFWHHIGSPMGHGSAAIYFDDGDGGDVVFGNVFFRCGDPGKGSFGTVFSHGGHDNLAENNIFVECKRALGSAPWSDQCWKETIDGGQDCDWHTKLLVEVDVTKPPYTTRYPQLVGFMDPQPGQLRINRAVRNLLVNCAGISSGNWRVDMGENLAMDGDPGFINAAKGDFSLVQGAEVFARLPGFQRIPFEKIGLVKDRLRPKLTAEAWPRDAGLNSGHG